MARPSQLLAVALVYSWGSLLALPAAGAVLPQAYLAGLVVLLLASASIHYTNEYADYDSDALAVRTPFSGGSGALHDHGAARQVALRAARITLLLGMAAAAVAALAGLLPLASLPLLALGVFLGWMYSLPPLALAWRGWGELTNAFLGGMLLAAWGYTVQAGRLDGRVLLLSLPFSLLVFNNLLATTWADRRADRAVGKLTLATRWPVHWLRSLYGLVAVAAFVGLALMRDWLLPGRQFFWAALLLLVVVALWAGHAYTRQHSPFPSVLAMVLLLAGQLSACLLRGCPL